MGANIKSPGALSLIAVLAVSVPAGLSAQELSPTSTTTPNSNPNIIVKAPGTTPGPDVKGIIVARNAEKIKVMAADGTATVVSIADTTKIKGGGGLFSSGGKFTADALLNGLPVSVKTIQSDDGLIASQITFKSGDFKTANMIRNGTNQRFEEQGAAIDKNAAATEALRGRMGDIDKYNIKSTTNVYFDTGKWALSPRAKADLCSAATAADATDNALMLVVGYTDSVGSDDYNQVLSEKRANSVINYLQQYCHWKPYRMLTPTGMAKADPLADNSTPEGKAQNRRVAVNVLVSKALDGM